MAAELAVIANKLQQRINVLSKKLDDYNCSFISPCKILNNALRACNTANVIHTYRLDFIEKKRRKQKKRHKLPHLTGWAFSSTISCFPVEVQAVEHKTILC